MSLHPDYLAILPKAIWQWQGVRHVFGASDCVCFVRDVLLRIGARDPLPKGINWSSRRGAFRVLRRMGGITGQLARIYPETSLVQLRSGDVLAREPDSEGVMGAVYIIHAGRAWSVLEGDAISPGGLVSEDVQLLVSQAGTWRGFAAQEAV